MSWFQAMKGAPKTFPKVVHKKGAKSPGNQPLRTVAGQAYGARNFEELSLSLQRLQWTRGKGFVGWKSAVCHSTLTRECSCIILYNPCVYFSIHIVYDLFHLIPMFKLMCYLVGTLVTRSSFFAQGIWDLPSDGFSLDTGGWYKMIGWQSHLFVSVVDQVIQPAQNNCLTKVDVGFKTSQQKQDVIQKKAGKKRLNARVLSRPS